MMMSNGTHVHQLLIVIVNKLYRTVTTTEQCAAGVWSLQNLFNDLLGKDWEQRLRWKIPGKGED